MQLESKIKFIDEKLKTIFENLESKNKELYWQIINALKDIEKNAFCGIQIRKRQIPKEYIKKYKIHNLWKYNLPNAWRLLYSIEADETIIISIVLEWLHHKEYNKTFHY